MTNTGILAQKFKIFCQADNQEQALYEFMYFARKLVFRNILSFIETFLVPEKMKIN